MTHLSIGLLFACWRRQTVLYVVQFISRYFVLSKNKDKSWHMIYRTWHKANYMNSQDVRLLLHILLHCLIVGGDVAVISVIFIYRAPTELGSTKDYLPQAATGVISLQSFKSTWSLDKLEQMRHFQPNAIDKPTTDTHKLHLCVLCVFIDHIMCCNNSASVEIKC